MFVLGLATALFCDDITLRLVCCRLSHFKRARAVQKQVRCIRRTAVLLLLLLLSPTKQTETSTIIHISLVCFC